MTLHGRSAALLAAVAAVGAAGVAAAVYLTLGGPGSFFPLLAAALAAAALPATGAWLLLRRLSRPVTRLTEVAEKVASGRLDVEIPSFRNDQADDLAHALRRMRDALVVKIGESEDGRRLALTVLAGMREALVWTGPDRKIRLANDAFRQIFSGGQDPTDHLLAEIVRSPTVIRELEQAIQTGREVRELVLQHPPGSGRTFEVHVTPFAGRPGGKEAGALVLFFDITRLEALERVRRDFVSNVSHELRTPLTSIKAFVETLLDDGLEDRESSLRFLGIVRKNVERMEALIDDLTDLSQIETGAVALEFREIDARELAREVAAHLEPLRVASGVEVRVDVPSGFPLRADRRRLEQILVNLLDNAIKFNRPGGWVRVEGGYDGGRPFLAVTDNGPGIPADSHERIFQRFYRVDKARSREVGGTGLGLAIVKHLMLLHGGTVRVESELGKGSRFVLEFPTLPVKETTART